MKTKPAGETPVDKKGVHQGVWDTAPHLAKGLVSNVPLPYFDPISRITTLMRESATQKAFKQRMAEEKEAISALQNRLQREKDEKTRVKLETEHHQRQLNFREDELFSYLQNAHDVSGALQDLATQIQHLIGATGVYIGEAKTDAGGQEYIEYIGASQGQTFMVGKKLFRGGEETPGPVFKFLDAWKAKVASEGQEGGEEEEAGASGQAEMNDTEDKTDPYVLHIRHVTDVPEVKFFRQPRQGALVGVPFSFDAFMDAAAFKQACEIFTEAVAGKQTFLDGLREAAAQKQAEKERAAEQKAKAAAKAQKGKKGAAVETPQEEEEEEPLPPEQFFSVFDTLQEVNTQPQRTLILFADTVGSAPRFARPILSQSSVSPSFVIKQAEKGSGGGRFRDLATDTLVSLDCDRQFTPEQIQKVKDAAAVLKAQLAREHLAGLQRLLRLACMQKRGALPALLAAAQEERESAQAAMAEKKKPDAKAAKGKKKAVQETNMEVPFEEAKTARDAALQNFAQLFNDLQPLFFAVQQPFPVEVPSVGPLVLSLSLLLGMSLDSVADLEEGGAEGEEDPFVDTTGFFNKHWSPSLLKEARQFFQTASQDFSVPLPVTFIQETAAKIQEEQLEEVSPVWGLLAKWVKQAAEARKLDAEHAKEGMRDKMFSIRALKMTEEVEEIIPAEELEEEEEKKDDDEEEDGEDGEAKGPKTRTVERSYNPKASTALEPLTAEGAALAGSFAAVPFPTEDDPLEAAEAGTSLVLVWGALEGQPTKPLDPFAVSEETEQALKEAVENGAQLLVCGDADGKSVAALNRLFGWELQAAVAPGDDRVPFLASSAVSPLQWALFEFAGAAPASGDASGIRAASIGLSRHNPQPLMVVPRRGLSLVCDGSSLPPNAVHVAESKIAEVSLFREGTGHVALVSFGLTGTGREEGETDDKAAEVRGEAGRSALESLLVALGKWPRVPSDLHTCKKSLEVAMKYSPAAEDEEGKSGEAPVTSAIFALHKQEDGGEGDEEGKEGGEDEDEDEGEGDEDGEGAAAKKPPTITTAERRKLHRDHLSSLIASDFLSAKEQRERREALEVGMEHLWTFNEKKSRPVELTAEEAAERAAKQAEAERRKREGEEEEPPDPFVLPDKTENVYWNCVKTGHEAKWVVEAPAPIPPLPGAEATEPEPPILPSLEVTTQVELHGTAVRIQDNGQFLKVDAIPPFGTVENAQPDPLWLEREKLSIHEIDEKKGWTVALWFRPARASERTGQRLLSVGCEDETVFPSLEIQISPEEKIVTRSGRGLSVPPPPPPPPPEETDKDGEDVKEEGQGEGEGEGEGEKEEGDGEDEGEEGQEEEEEVKEEVDLLQEEIENNWRYDSEIFGLEDDVTLPEGSTGTSEETCAFWGWNLIVVSQEGILRKTVLNGKEQAACTHYIGKCDLRKWPLSPEIREVPGEKEEDPKEKVKMVMPPSPTKAQISCFAHPDFNVDFRGEIAGLAFWNRPLSVQEANDLFVASLNDHFFLHDPRPPKALSTVSILHGSPLVDTQEAAMLSNTLRSAFEDETETQTEREGEGAKGKEKGLTPLCPTEMRGVSFDLRLFDSLAESALVQRVLDGTDFLVFPQLARSPLQRPSRQEVSTWRAELGFEGKVFLQEEERLLLREWVSLRAGTLVLFTDPDGFAVDVVEAIFPGRIKSTPPPQPKAGSDVSQPPSVLFPRAVLAPPKHLKDPTKFLPTTVPSTSRKDKPAGGGQEGGHGGSALGPFPGRAPASGAAHLSPCWPTGGISAQQLPAHSAVLYEGTLVDAFTVPVGSNGGRVSFFGYFGGLVEPEEGGQGENGGEEGEAHAGAAEWKEVLSGLIFGQKGVDL